MRRIIITDDGESNIHFERISIPAGNAALMLSASLIAICRDLSVTEEQLNTFMSVLWEEGNIEEAE